MAFELARSALQLSESTVSVLGAVSGVELATTSPPAASPITACTCNGKTSLPPCYTCTFSLNHSPPPYDDNFKRKTLKIDSTEDSRQESSANEIKPQDSKSAAAQFVFPDTYLAAEKTNGVSCNSGVRPRIYPSQHRTVQLVTIVQDEVLASGDDEISASIQLPTTDPNSTQYRERLASVSAFKETNCNGTRHLTSRPVRNNALLTNQFTATVSNTSVTTMQTLVNNNKEFEEGGCSSSKLSDSDASELSTASEKFNSFHNCASNFLGFPQHDTSMGEIADSASMQNVDVRGSNEVQSELGNSHNPNPLPSQIILPD